MNKTVIFFHEGCHDGLTGAWALSKVFPEAHFIPMQPDKAPWATGREYGRPGDDVRFIFVDVACDKSKLMQLLDSGVVHVLDHHPKQIDGLRNSVFDTYPSLTKFRAAFVGASVVFVTPDPTSSRPDMSGAGLAFLYASEERGLEDPSDGIRRVCAYAQDKDLWVWKMPHSKAVAAFVEAQVNREDYRQAFHDLDDVATVLVNDLNSVILSGESIIRARRQRIKEALGRAIVRGVTMFIPCERDIRNYVAEEALKKHTSGPVVTFSVEKGGEVWCSARGRGAREIALAFGGEGHETAAGFQVSVRQLAGMLV